MKIQDSGPFEVLATDNDIYILSDDFTYDVKFTFDGDFVSREEKYSYAKHICDRLNSFVDTISVDPP